MLYDVVIVGGGPGGLQAALTLGRARKRVLLCDAGPRRNLAAEEVHNFVTRDGTPPEEFRRVGREQLRIYPSVEVRDARVEAIAGERGAFRVTVGSDVIEARRVLLCTGMIDQMLPIEGFGELWGHGIVQCPYCHGWEVRERKWGFLARPEHGARLLPFAFLLRAWTDEVTVFTDGTFELPEAGRAELEAAGVRVERSAVVRLVGDGGHLREVELANGTRVPCEMLFTHPPQRQPDLVASLGVALDGDGFVQVDPATRETSRPGIYAAGDTASQLQTAISAAASAMQAAANINMELTRELVAAAAR